MKQKKKFHLLTLPFLILFILMASTYADPATPVKSAVSANTVKTNGQTKPAKSTEPGENTGLPDQAGYMSDSAVIRELFSGDKIRINDALVYISKNKSPELLQRLYEVLLSNEEASRKSAAIKALKHYSYRATLPLCIDILEKTPSFLVRKEIIDYMAKSHSRRIVIPVAKELSSPFSNVRESAILALKAVGDDRMYPYLLNMIESDNPIHKVYALEALYHLYDMRFYSVLISTLKNENKSIRYYVLKVIDNNRIRESLLYVRRTAVKDASWEVRVKALQILGNLRDDKSLYSLLSCIVDKNREVRFHAAKSLFIMGFRNSAYAISDQLSVETDDEIKRIIIDTLVKLGSPGGYKGLRRVLLNDENVERRIQSAFALGAVRYNGSIGILLKAINDKDPKVRAEVCNSLGYYRFKDVVTALLDVINDGSSRYVRTAALYSIKRIGKRYVIVPLFDRYVIEDDPIFKEKLRFVLRGFLR